MESSLEDTKWLVKEWLSNMDAMIETFKQQSDEILGMLAIAATNKIVEILLKKHKILRNLTYQLNAEICSVRAAKEILQTLDKTLDDCTLKEDDLKQINEFVLDTAEELYCEIVKAKHQFINKFYFLIQSENNLPYPRLDLTKAILILLENVEDVEDAAHIIMTQLEPAIKAKNAMLSSKSKFDVI